MKQKFIIGDIVMYDNKVMAIKEPRDGSHFDLSCHKEGLVYFFVSVEDIAPIPLTPEILEKNGWEFAECHKDEDGFEWHIFSKDGILLDLYYYPADKDFSVFICGEEALPDVKWVHQLQHSLFGLGLNSEMEV